MNIEKIYTLSGWCLVPIWIALIFIGRRHQQIFSRHYLFIFIYFIAILILDIISNITVQWQMNNQWINYLYIPVEFGILCLYLQGYRADKNIRLITILVIVLFSIFQLLLGINPKFNNQFNYLGFYINTPILILFPIWNLTKLFKNSDGNRNIIYQPDFWFTLTILAMNVIDFVAGVLIANNFISGNEDTQWAVFSIRNILRCICLYGFFNGIKLLR